VNYVTAIYEPFEPQEVSDKIEMLSSPEIKAEVKLFFKL
jgi:amidophosphoribosyltransferase